MTRDETKAVDALAIPTCVPEIETEDTLSSNKHTGAFDGVSSSPPDPTHMVLQAHISISDNLSSSHTIPAPSPSNTIQQSPNLLPYSLPERFFVHTEADEMRLALQTLNNQYTHDRHHSPWATEFNIPLPESPETSSDAASGAASPIFSSIRGDASDTGTSHRLSDLRDWPLKTNYLSDFEFHPDQGPDMNRSLEHLRIRTGGTESTTSTAMPYQLPNTNPFAHSKESIDRPAQREQTQIEQLLDEFEYLGSALL
jgi:hypothetical protein